MQQIVSNPDDEVLSTNTKYQFVKNPTQVLYHPYDGEYTFEAGICRRRDLTIEVAWSAALSSGVTVPPQRTTSTAMEGYYLAYQQVMALFKSEGEVLAWIKFQTRYLERFMDVLRFEFDIPEVGIG